MPDLGEGGFGCNRWDAATALRCCQLGRWGMVEEAKLRDSEAVENLKETGSIGMIIGEILRLFDYISYPFSFSPLSCGVRRKLTMRLQVLGWICTELPPTLTLVTGRSISVRHHGTCSILGVNKKLTWTKI